MLLDVEDVGGGRSMINGIEVARTRLNSHQTALMMRVCKIAKSKRKHVSKDWECTNTLAHNPVGGGGFLCKDLFVRWFEPHG